MILKRQLQNSEAYGANILTQNELDANLTYSNRVGKFASNSLWIKRLDAINLRVLQLPLNLTFYLEANMIRKILLLSTLCTAFLSAEVRVLVFSGSTREDSANKKLVKEAARLATQMGAKVAIIDLKDFPMPFYDRDIEEKNGQPTNASRLREMMIRSDAMIIATPEYNASVSGILKNTLDWVSRNEKGQPSRDAFKGKRIAIMSAAPGNGGAERALNHLRSIIEDIGGTVVGTQVSVPDSYNAFAPDGSLKNAQLQEKLKREIEELITP